METYGQGPANEQCEYFGRIIGAKTTETLQKHREVKTPAAWAFRAFRPISACGLSKSEGRGFRSCPRYDQNSWHSCMYRGLPRAEGLAVPGHGPS